jgi:Fungal specific transcription factor domain/Fungal Zn(2)-Cys(6) binuclear cluster domain
MVKTPNPRICGGKVKTGCVTCKARHVKCGEEKPQCKRCITTGRICDGYSNSKVAVKPAVKRSANELIMIHYTADVPAALKLAMGRTTKEQRSFEYFRTRTAPDLMACFDSELWSSYVLQMAQTEPAVRHSLIAVGCLHEDYESGTIGYGANAQFALQQYSTAIRHVLRSFKSYLNQSTDIALVLCALFASFESLQGHYKSALTHIISGMNVLRERQAKAACSTRTDGPTGFINNLFNRLGSQVIEIGDQSMPCVQYAEQNHLIDPLLPSTFSTLEEAQDSFNILLHKFYTLGYAKDTTADVSSLSPAETWVTNQASSTHFFERWSTAFDDYLVGKLRVAPSVGHPCKLRMQPGVYILQIWRTVVTIVLSIDMSAGEMAVDRFMSEFETVIDLAAAFLDSTARFTPGCTVDLQPISHTTASRQNDCQKAESHGVSEHELAQCSCTAAGPYANSINCLSQGTCRLELSSEPLLAPKPAQTIKPTFSLSLGIIPPLYIVSTRCRDPVIRRKAIHLLSICKRREGVWDSWLSSQVARRILEIEEEAAQQFFARRAGENGEDVPETVSITSILQVPEEARIVHMGTLFGPDRQGTLRYRRSTHGREGLGYEETIFDEPFEW